MALISTPNRLHRWQYRPGSFLLAEGDSWFCYPGEKNGILSPYDIIMDVADHYDVYSFAHFGDTIATMASDTNLKTIKNRLSYVLHGPSTSKLIKAFLISGGGNDLFDTGNPNNYLAKIIKMKSSNDPLAYIDEDELSKCMRTLEKYYNKFISTTRKFLNPNIKYALHTYDYAIPDNTPYEGIVKTGPWLWPVLSKKNVHNTAIGQKIIMHIVDTFYEMLTRVTSAQPNTFIIDLRNTLQDKSLWENEIHPSRKGFEVIGDVYYKALKDNL